MRRRLHRAHPRVAGPLVALLAFTALGACTHASAATRAQAPVATPSASDPTAAERVARYWTPERMRNARPLDLVVGAGGEARLRVGPAEAAGAGASFLAVSTPDIAPYSFSGRIFIRRGDVSGYCSGTAIDSPTRQLVLTAGHCINSGREGGERTIWSDYLQFVPAYSGGVAPFGSFVARRSKIFASKQWTKHGNPDFDLGAFLALPNARGENLADAVGGGATIVTDVSRYQTFRTFGYPGKVTRMQSCTSPYVGDDLLSNPLPGPPTLGIRCHWAPGASGGGWLIGDTTEINGLNAYLHYRKKSHTYGPYFAAETVGRLVRGL